MVTMLCVALIFRSLDRMPQEEYMKAWGRQNLETDSTWMDALWLCYVRDDCLIFVYFNRMDQVFNVIYHPLGFRGDLFRSKNVMYVIFLKIILLQGFPI